MRIGSSHEGAAGSTVTAAGAGAGGEFVTGRFVGQRGRSQGPVALQHFAHALELITTAAALAGHSTRKNARLERVERLVGRLAQLRLGREQDPLAQAEIRDRHEGAQSWPQATVNRQKVAGRRKHDLSQHHADRRTFDG